MTLYLIQHAQALTKDEDPGRGLSEEGLDSIRRIVRLVQPMNISVSRILHSGKKRAAQTAQLLNECVSSEHAVQETEGLAPMDSPGVWAERLTGSDEDVMLVGHLPHLAKLAALLLCGSEEGTAIDFQNGGVVCLKRSDDGSWSAAWIITPEMIKRDNGN